MVNVIADTLSGTQIDDSWTVVQAGGSTVAQGYAPVAFKAPVGASYVVSVASNARDVFSHWSDGDPSPSRTLTVNGTTDLSAVYTARRR
jgi:hypothetical protein